MAFEPRTTQVIRREVAGRIVARGPLTDISEGSALAHIAEAVAEEAANVEVRAARIRDSFYLEGAEGQDLDDRVSDLPPSGLSRQHASAGSGGSLSLVRADTTAEVTVPAGSTYGRTDNGAVLYRQIADATFLVGQDTLTEVAVVCLTVGLDGNCRAGQINRVLSAPGVDRVTNTAPITNAQGEEQDEDLRARARAYLSSLTGTTPAALEYLGRSFESSNRARAAFARVFEDPTQPGYSELLIDDGSGLVGYTRPGVPVTGTVPAGGPPVLWHEAPAVDPPDGVSVLSGGVLRELLAEEYTSIPERGMIFVNEGVLSPGDQWEIAKYRVFTGLPAEIQAAIEGNTSDPLNSPGYRAAGTRVRVQPPQVTLVDLYVNVVPIQGRDYEVVRADTKDAVIQYLATLGPGQPLYIARLVDRIMDNPDVLTVRLYSEPDSLTQAVDYLPASPRHVLRTDDARVTVVPLPQEV